MTDKITQELGFEVGGAIRSLESLNRNLERFNRNLDNTARTSDRFSRDTGRAGRTLDQFGQKANDNIRRGNNAAKVLGTEGSSNIQKFTVTFQTLIRVVQTQVIVRSIAAIQSALNESVGASVNFQNSIAEISTISSNKDLEQLSDSVIRLSDNFNIPAIEVAGSLYQTLSNQIGESFQQQEKFVGSILKFSRVAVTDAADAGNLVAGVLNGYNLEAEDADRITAKLFKTIELGRTTGRELASSLGNAIPVASQLGVEFDELLASVDDVTLSGVSTARAITQIRGAMLAFIKPSEDMKRVLNELGFDNGEQAIGALGFAGAIRAVTERVGGSSTEVAKLFRNVRGLNAALRIGVDPASRFNESLAEIQNVSIADLNEEFARFTSTDASSVTKELNAIKNIFQQEFGAQVLEGASSLNELREPIAVVARGLGLFTNVMITGTSELVKLTNAVIETEGPLGKLGTLIDGFRGADLDQGQAEFLEDLERRSFELNQTAIRNAEERLNAELASNRAITRSSRGLLANLRRVFNDRKELVRESVEEFAQLEESAFQKIIASQDQFVTAIRGRIKEIRSDIQESQDRLRELSESDRALALESRLTGLSPERQVRARLDEARSLSGQASRILSTRTDEASQQQALRLFEQAEDQISKLIQLDQRLERSGFFRRDIQSAQRLITSRRRNAELALQANLESQIDPIKEQEEAAKRVSLRFLELKKIIEESNDLFDRDGQIFSDEELDRRRLAGANARREIADLLQGEIERGASLGLDFIQRELSDSLSNAEIQAISVSSEARDNLFSQIQSVLNQGLVIRNIELDIDRLSEQREELAKDRAIAEAQLGTIRTDQEAIAEATERIVEENRRIDQEGLERSGVRTIRAFTLGDVRRFSRLDPQEQGTLDATTRQGDTGFTFAGLAEADRIAEELRRLSREQIIDPGDVNDLVEQIETLRLSGGKFIQDQADILESQVDRLRNILRNQTEVRASGFAPGGEGFIREGNNLTEQQLLFDRLFDRFLEAPTKIRPFGESVDQLQTNASSAKVTIDQLNQSLARTGRQNFAERNLVQTGLPGRVFGGLINFLQEGGVARGQDTQPAMLAPGESVFSAEATRGFFSQLQATNAMQRPSAVNGSGNTIFGDISVTVNESKRPGQTGREVALALDRERRRGTSRF